MGTCAIRRIVYRGLPGPVAVNPRWTAPMGGRYALTAVAAHRPPAEITPYGYEPGDGRLGIPCLERPHTRAATIEARRPAVLLFVKKLPSAAEDALTSERILGVAEG